MQDTYDTLIDKVDPRTRTKREDYWIHTVKAKAPMGLILYSYLITVSYPGIEWLVLGLHSDYSDYRYIYFM